jgi:hypothetical protein
VSRRRVATALVAALTAVLALSPGAAYAADTVTSNGPSVQWDFNERYGTTTTDRSGNGVTGTLGSGASWTTTAHAGGGAVNLDGSANSYVDGGATGPNTAGDYTFSVWAYVPSAAADQFLVSQNGTNAYGAAIMVVSGKWAVGLVQTDAAAGTKKTVPAGAVAVNTWTHIVGTFDAATKGLVIYVNGSAVTAAAATAAFNATGTLQVGRGVYGGGYTTPASANTRIDDVRAYPRKLSASEVANLYSDTYYSPELRWDFNESGTAAADKTANNANGTLGSGASWTTTASHSGGRSINFDGTNSAYVSTANTIDSTQSFTVSAWVNLTAGGGNTQTVLAEGTNTSAFLLKYENGSGQSSWMFLTTQSDSTSSGVQDKIGTSNSASAGTWAHLVGVYNASTDMIYLYVNGALDSSTSHTTTWGATGNFQVGRMRWGGSDINGFNGRIDDVRAYQRALSTTEISDLYHDSPPGLSGCLYMTTQSFAFSNTALTGANKTITATAAAPWSITDARGTGGTWSATISASPLTTVGGTVETAPQTIPVGQMSMTNGTVTAAAGADPTSHLTSTAVTMSASQQVFLASSGTNRGTYTFTPTFQIVVPAKAYRSNYSGAVGSTALNPYTATITVTVS